MSEHSDSAAGAGDPALAVWLGQLQEASFNRAGPAVCNAYPPERRMTGPQLAGYLTRRTYALASSTRANGRAHAAPTLFTSYAEAFWLPTLGNALRLDNVRANPWLALSILEGEHDTHAAVLTEGPAEVLTAVPQDVRNATELRNDGATLDWATAWLRVTPKRLFSFAEHGWHDVPGSTSARRQSARNERPGAESDDDEHDPENRGGDDSVHGHHRRIDTRALADGVESAAAFGACAARDQRHLVRRHPG